MIGLPTRDAGEKLGKTVRRADDGLWDPKCSLRCMTGAYAVSVASVRRFCGPPWAKTWRIADVLPGQPQAAPHLHRQQGGPLPGNDVTRHPCHRHVAQQHARGAPRRTAVREGHRLAAVLVPGRAKVGGERRHHRDRLRVKRGGCSLMSMLPEKSAWAPRKELPFPSVGARGGCADSRSQQASHAGARRGGRRRQAVPARLT